VYKTKVAALKLAQSDSISGIVATHCINFWNMFCASSAQYNLTNDWIINLGLPQNLSFSPFGHSQ
jgi:hypothetical protein